MRAASGTDLLIDTDVFIDHIRGARPIPRIAAAYSTITRCELFAGPERDEAAISMLLTPPLREMTIDRAIAEHAGRLRRRLHMSVPDAIIAATALERGLDLVTRNRKDFTGVEGLRVRDPSTLI